MFKFYESGNLIVRTDSFDSLVDTVYSDIKKHKKEDGCVEPLYGKKSKCVLNIVPKETRVPTLTVDKQCIKKRN